MDATLEGQAFSVLAVLAAILMVVVTGGVVYLTAAEWRDRRRYKADQAPVRRRSTRKTSKNSKK